MIGELFINGKDAYTTWGISMDDTSLSALMTPAPNKDLVENKSRLEHGKRVITDNPKRRTQSNLANQSLLLQIKTLSSGDMIVFVMNWKPVYLK